MMINIPKNTKLTDLDKKLENGNGTNGYLWTDTDRGLRASLLPRGGDFADKLWARKTSGRNIVSSENTSDRTNEGTPGSATVGRKTVSTTEPIE